MKNIVIDLDGTLLRSDKTISSRSRTILQQLMLSGKRIIIATARPPRGVYNLIPDEWHALEIIFYNGALIHRNRQPIFQKSIRTDVAITIKQILEAYPKKVAFGFEQNDWLYATGSFEHHWPRTYYTEVDVNALAIDNPAKVLVDLPGPEILAYLQANLPEDCRLIVTDRNTLGQIMSQGVSKYAALLALIPNAAEVADQTLCFGDDTNDIDIFQHCANSVAMENATAEVRSLAKYLAKSNDQDGVAHFLRDYFSTGMKRVPRT